MPSDAKTNKTCAARSQITHLPRHGLTVDNSWDDTNYSNSRLATLLPEPYEDIGNLRRELSAGKKRAEKAERLLFGFQTIQQCAGDVSLSSGPSPDVAPETACMTTGLLSTAILLTSMIEHRARDARANYARVNGI